MDDLISRKALLEDIKVASGNDFMGTMVAGTLTRFVKKQPAVDAAPVVHGEWIGYETSSYNGNDEYGEPRWIPKKFFRCSICRKGTAVRHNFCPNCGAKIDGGNDND